MSDLRSEIEKEMNSGGTVPPEKYEVQKVHVEHARMLLELLEQIEEVDFVEAAKLKPGEKLTNSQIQIIVVEMIEKTASKNNWALCTHNNMLYMYNSECWCLIERDELQSFLGQAAQKMGVGKFTAKYYKFQKQLTAQFRTQSILPRKEIPNNRVLVNLKNGTFEVTPDGTKLREFDRNDFLTYQLAFNYDPEATAPMFTHFLNRVLPDEKCQMVLSEFLGSIFISAEILKTEKALMLLGDGANGKSVMFEIVNSLLGENNVSSFSLASLMEHNSYTRALLANRLLNYASEITGDLEAGVFKQLTSGEPVSARMIYEAPITIRNYAKLAFNCNGLPKNVEHTHAYFRRFLIIRFGVTIPEHEQDKQLAQKIIASGELSGIFNWVLAGLRRLLDQKGFTYSEAVNQELAKYKAESDSVKSFLDEYGYEECFERYVTVKSISTLYGEFCKEYRYRPVSHVNFVNRLRALDVRIEKRNVGLVAFLQRRPDASDDTPPSGTPHTSLTPLFDHGQI